MKLKKVEKIPVDPALCIEVDSPDRLFAAGGATGDAVVSHNSVTERNILISAILRPEYWRVLCIDLKRVEFSPYRKYKNVILGVATDVEDAVTVLRFAQETMMKRYSKMEDLGVNFFLDLPEEERSQALLVIIDEVGELLGTNNAKALSEETLIPTPDNGLVRLADLQVGDMVYNSYCQPVKVSQKYEPETQERYHMVIRREKDGETVTVVSGGEHQWVVQSGKGQEVLKTRELFYRAKNGQTESIRFLKHAPDGEEWFTLDNIVLNPSSTDRLYCISVDSPDHQFLATPLGVPTKNTDEAKAENALKGEASMIISSLARLGRAAGVYIVLCTQRPDATIIPGETKANLGVRINCGKTDSNASSMILGSSEGTKVKSNPPGRLYLSIYNAGNHGQGLFAKDSTWLDEWFEEHGLNPDGTPIEEEGDNDTSGWESPEVGVAKKDKDKWHRAEDDWDDELEELINENFNQEQE